MFRGGHQFILSNVINTYLFGHGLEPQFPSQGTLGALESIILSTSLSISLLRQDEVTALGVTEAQAPEGIPIFFFLNCMLLYNLRGQQALLVWEKPAQSCHLSTSRELEQTDGIGGGDAVSFAPG